MGNKKDLNNRKRTTKKAHSTYKLQVIFTQGEKVAKDMHKGKRPELTQKYHTFTTTPSLPMLSQVFSSLAKWP